MPARLRAIFQFTVRALAVNVAATHFAAGTIQQGERT
jgi:hypothetical protein